MKSSKLSFNMDEEDDEEEVVIIKKDVNNKTVKKMRQAPPLTTLPQVLAPTPSYLNSGSSYNTEYLDQLRSNQKFVMKSTVESSTAMEGVIMNGEAAEQFTNITDALNKNTMATDDLFKEDFDAADDSADFMAFKTGQMTSKNILKGKTDNRMYTEPKSGKALLDMSEENDSEWEAEIMRRGVISSSSSGNNYKAPTADSKHSSSDGKNVKGGSLSSSDDSKKETQSVSLEDVTKLVQTALDRLRVSSAGHERQISMLTINKSKAEEKRLALQARLNTGVDRLNLVQDIRIFFAALVGMVRAKQPLIQQLSEATFTTLRAQSEARRRLRVEEQEDCLCRAREARELMTVGEYAPSSSLLNSGGSEGSADVETREGHRRFARLQVLSDANLSQSDCDVMSRLSETDKAHFISGRVDQIASGAGGHDTRRALYRLLERVAIERLATPEFLSKLSVLSSARVACMEDVAGEVYSMREIVTKLTAFREAYPDKYRSAFISLSLPDVLEPLLLFDVLGCSSTVFALSGANSASIESQSDEMGSAPSVSSQSGLFAISEREWHESLREFSASSGDGGDVDSSEQADATVESLVQEGDSNLLPKLVVSAVLPWLVQCVQTVLDPLDTAACVQCADLVGQVLDYDPGAGPLTAMLEAVVDVFTAEIAVTCVPVVKTGSSGQGVAFLERQLYRVEILLENFALFKEYLSPPVVIRLVWRVLSSQCLAPLVKLLSSPDFQHMEIVESLVSLSLTLLAEEQDEESEVSVGRSAGMRAAEHVRLLVTCGVNMAAHRELKSALDTANSNRSNGLVVQTRTSFLQAFSKI